MENLSENVDFLGYKVNISLYDRKFSILPYLWYRKNGIFEILDFSWAKSEFEKQKKSSNLEFGLHDFLFLQYKTLFFALFPPKLAAESYLILKILQISNFSGNFNKDAICLAGSTLLYKI